MASHPLCAFQSDPSNFNSEFVLDMLCDLSYAVQQVSGGSSASLVQINSDIQSIQNQINSLNSQLSSLNSQLNGLSSDKVDRVGGTSTGQTLNNATFTGSVTGLRKGMVQLSQVNNTSDLDKPISIPQKAYVDNAIASLVDSAPEDLNTLKELAQAICNDPSYCQTITSTIRDISNNYLTKNEASSTYLTQTSASSTYLTQTEASGTYLKIANYNPSSGGSGASMIGGFAKDIKKANTTYFGLFAGSNDVNADANENFCFNYMPFNCTISNLYIYLVGNPGSGQNYKFTVRKNAVDTSLNVTVSGSASTPPPLFVESNLVNSVTFSQGDRFTISAIPSSSSATDNIDVRWTAKLVAN